MNHNRGEQEKHVRRRLSPGVVRSGGAPANLVQSDDGKRPPVFGNGRMRSE
jgi:hypothetical protein